MFASFWNALPQRKSPVINGFRLLDVRVRAGYLTTVDEMPLQFIDILHKLLTDRRCSTN